MEGAALCEFCRKHAEEYGKWYLNPKGYSEEFFRKLSIFDRILHRQPRKVRELWEVSDAAWYPLSISKTLDLVDLAAKPFIGRIIKIIGNMIAVRGHAGQVVPLEDAYKIVELSESQALFPCMCKRLFKGEDEYKCLNFTPAPEFAEKHPRGWRVKELETEEAKEKLREFAEKGYVHAVFWWCGAPQVICICNCDTKYCYAARPRLWYDIKNAYRKSEYVAEVDPDKCSGDIPRCGNCVSRCQFGAIKIRDGKAAIDPYKCFGCGQCRFGCEEDAIRLVDRNTHPIAQRLW